MIQGLPLVKCCPKGDFGNFNIHPHVEVTISDYQGEKTTQSLDLGQPPRDFHVVSVVVTSIQFVKTRFFTVKLQLFTLSTVAELIVNRLAVNLTMEPDGSANSIEPYLGVYHSLGQAPTKTTNQPVLWVVTFLERNLSSKGTAHPATG